jgi:hypothetical protein
VVRKRGFEPLRYCYRQPLKLLKLAGTRKQTWTVSTNLEHKRAEACAPDDFFRTDSHNIRDNNPELSRRRVIRSIHARIASELTGEQRPIDKKPLDGVDDGPGKRRADEATVVAGPS